MPVEWPTRKPDDPPTNMRQSLNPRGFTITATPYHDEMIYTATWSGEPHKPSILMRRVSIHDLAKKKQAAQECKAACDQFWDSVNPASKS